MATNKRAKAVCDISGFVYPRRVMRLNSYGMLGCTTDFDGAFDLKNSPLNKIPDVRDNPNIRNPRPDTGGRTVYWNTASTKWEDETKSWNNA